VSGIFASQFNTVNPYDPVGLDTGTPSVGVTLGKKTPKAPETPAAVGAGITAAGSAAAEESAAATGYQHATAANGAGAMAGSYNANKAGLQSLGMSSANRAANGISLAHPPVSTVQMPKLSGADATPPKPSTASGGGGLFGWAAHTFDTARHDTARGLDIAGHDIKTSGSQMKDIFQQQNSFGEPQFQPGYKAPDASKAANNTAVNAQHGANAFVSRPGTGAGAIEPGVSSTRSIGLGQDGGYYNWVNNPEARMAEQSSQEIGSSAAQQAAAAAPSLENDLSHINWAQFFQNAGRDIGEEG
jgi:hypothetical protein